MKPRARKAAGCFILLAYLALYTMAAVTLGGVLAERAPTWALLIFFAVAGFAWVLPLRPLIGWMKRP
jgi:Protein of unknown function (DUF2842)